MKEINECTDRWLSRFFTLTGCSDNWRLAAALNKDRTPFPLLLIATLTLSLGFMSNSKSCSISVNESRCQSLRKREGEIPLTMELQQISRFGWFIWIVEKKKNQKQSESFWQNCLEILAPVLWQLIIIWGKKKQSSNFIDLMVVISPLPLFLFC